MPAPIQPPKSSAQPCYPKDGTAKPHAAKARARAVRRAAQAPNAAKKQQAQLCDGYARHEHPRSKTPGGTCPAPASTPPKLSFAETLLQLDRALQRSAYYAVTTHPPTPDAQL